jgi:hypothetical protein
MDWNHWNFIFFGFRGIWNTIDIVFFKIKIYFLFKIIYYLFLVLIY